MWAITWQNLKSIPQRWGPAVVAIIGVAGVVAVFVAVLSIARGFERTLAAGAAPERVVVLRSGSSSELDSGLSGEQIRIIEEAPGLLRDADGEPLASPELYVMVDLEKRSTGTPANVPLRGVTPRAFSVRDELTVVEGRRVAPGRKEIMAGRGAQDQFSGLEVGTTLEFGSDRWDVVGIFEADGGVVESELWADAAVVQSAFRRGNSYAVVYGRLETADALDAFRDQLTSDPRMSVKVQRESAYFAEQSRALSIFISAVGYLIAVLMALGATFGALNTMYSTVSERAREIATLRALGFSGMPIVGSVMIEALVLALSGGLLGGLVAWLLFNGYTVSTLNFSSFTQVVFAFAVTPDLLVKGILIALVVGLIGGLAPALRAARLPISTALRQL